MYNIFVPNKFYGVHMEEKAISSDLIRGHIDTIILHSLLDGDKHAQKISETVEKKSDNRYSINQATLYSSLKRLETLKYVNAYWNDSESGRRRYFKLTEKGKSVVEQNLSNWTYSREIIDKLMDFESTPIYRTQVVEKIVTVPQPAPQSEVKIVQENTDKPVETTDVVVVNEKNVTTERKPENDTILSESQEINFRNILNGLIKVNKRNKETACDIENVKSNDTVTAEKNVESENKLKLNETITVSDYNTLKSANANGRIDYGEMAIQAEKEGYKLRFSSKESKRPKGSVYINRINLCAALAVFLLVMIEYLIVIIGYKSVLNPTFLSIALSVLALLIFPMAMIIVFCKNPLLTAKDIKKDTMLTALIVVFNLLLVTFALDLLVGVDFSNRYTFLISFLIPCLLYADIFVYYVFRYCFSKMKDFSIDRNKKQLN